MLVCRPGAHVSANQLQTGAGLGGERAAFVPRVLEHVVGDIHAHDVEAPLGRQLRQRQGYPSASTPEIQDARRRPSAQQLSIEIDIAFLAFMLEVIVGGMPIDRIDHEFLDGRREWSRRMHSS